MDSAAYNPRTPEEVFKDFRARRAGIIKALSTGIICFFRFIYVSSQFLKISLPPFLIPENCSIFPVVCFFSDVEKFYQDCDPGYV
jgi:hypothetical protein